MLGAVADQHPSSSPADVADRACRSLVAAIGGPDATPAGGAAGIAAIAMGVALGTKVLRLSPALPAELAGVGPRLDALLRQLLPEFPIDCRSFAELLAAFRLPRQDPARAGAVRAAWIAATQAPVRTAVLAHEVEALLRRCVDRVNQNLAGDLTAARELVGAGLRIAIGNARENAGHLPPDVAADLLAALPA
jgi:formiminotetrahydrofolate cyclodeaminase